MSFNNVSGTIRINVSGLLESIRGIDGLIRELPQTKLQIIREGALFFFKDAQKNAHVITGKTKASIHIESITVQQGIISAGFGMPFEEKRGGQRLDTGTPHKTFTVAAKNTGVEMPHIIKRAFDALLARHRTR
jgi:hypothetical protein